MQDNSLADDDKWLIELGVGPRIQTFRQQLGLSQPDLAASAELSLDTIRAIEQGKRGSISVPTLRKIARGLGRNMFELLGAKPATEEAPDQAVEALCRAVADVDALIGGGDTEPIDPTDLGSTMTYLWGAYWGGDYRHLATLLSPTLGGLRATQRQANLGDQPAARKALAEAYWVAGCTLTHLHRPESAFHSIAKAVDHADQSNDELLAAGVRGSVAWQLLVDTDRVKESAPVAVRAAESIEPRGDVSLAHLSTYGSLILTAGNAAARAGDRDTALDHLAASAEVARRIGHDRDDYHTNFGPSQVAMQTVDIHVVTEHYADALSAATAMPGGGQALHLASRARHQADRAFALTRLGRFEDATHLLLATESMAPKWFRHQQLVKTTTAELRERQRRRADSLDRLAEKAGLKI